MDKGPRRDFKGEHRRNPKSDKPVTPQPAVKPEPVWSKQREEYVRSKRWSTPEWGTR